MHGGGDDITTKSQLDAPVYSKFYVEFESPPVITQDKEKAKQFSMNPKYTVRYSVRKASDAPIHRPFMYGYEVKKGNFTHVNSIIETMSKPSRLYEGEPYTADYEISKSRADFEFPDTSNPELTKDEAIKHIKATYFDGEKIKAGVTIYAL